MAKTNFKTIDEYQSTFTGDVLKKMQAIRKLVHQIMPEAEEVISYQIPAFKIGKQFLIYYCAFPKHLTLSSPWSEAFLEGFENDLMGMKVSKSAIQFPHDKPLPLDLIKRILVFRKKEVEVKR
ncbi:iron chaperone [Niabella aquatica]